MSKKNLIRNFLLGLIIIFTLIFIAVIWFLWGLFFGNPFTESNFKRMLADYYELNNDENVQINWSMFDNCPEVEFTVNDETGRKYNFGLHIHNGKSLEVRMITIEDESSKRLLTFEYLCQKPDHYFPNKDFMLEKRVFQLSNFNQDNEFNETTGLNDIHDLTNKITLS